MTANSILDRALERCQLFNLVGQLGETFEAYGNLYCSRRDFARAAEFYERAARSYDEAGIDLARVELLEEQAFLSLRAGDAARARGQIDRLVELRPTERNESPLHGYSGARPNSFGAVRIRRSPQTWIRRWLISNSEVFITMKLRPAWLSRICDFASSHEPQMLEHLRRVLDLAARYDYEYWLRQEIASHPALFASEDARELLPPDLITQVEEVSVDAKPALEPLVTPQRC